MSFPGFRITKDQAADLSGGAIEVLVGTEPQVTFSVHEALVRKASDFFDKALSHEWKESKERSVSLSDTDPDTFQLYLHWLYFRILPIKADAPGRIGDMEYLQLAKAYVLGDLLQDVDFNDAVIDTMIEKSCTPTTNGKLWYPGETVIACIYNNTPASSKARRVLIDMYVNFGHGGWLPKAEEMEKTEHLNVPKEFLLDLATALLYRRPCNHYSLKDKDDACKYHCHGATKECYRNGPGPGRVAAVEKPN